MKTKHCLCIIVFFMLVMPVLNLFLEPAASQPIPQNNVPDSQYVSLIGRWAYGPCMAVAVDTIGNIAYFGNGSYLEIISLANPSKPTRLSKILLPAPILDIAINGGYVYVANAGAGLRTINIDNPSDPVEQPYLETLGIASGLAIDGNKIYLADGDRGLLVFNIDIPWEPKQTDSCNTDGWASSVAVSGDFAYVADRQGGLKVIDITDPSNLRLAGSYTTTDDVMDVAISSTYAYLAAGSAGLRILDIADTNNNPVEVDSLVGHQFATAIATDGIRAYLTDKETGLRIIDISDPNNPNEIGHLDTDGSPQDIALNSLSALVADGHKGLRVIDVSNYTYPKEIGHFDTDRSSRGVAVDSSFAYLVRGEAGLRVLDISDPSKPDTINSLNFIGQAEDVLVNENYAYLTNYENGLQVIDISDPASINAIGSIAQNINSKRIAIKGDYAYVADTTYGLRVVDISDPSQPGVIESLEFPGKRAEAIAIKENYAYLAAGNDGLVIVDIATPSQPSQVGIRDLGGTAISIDVEENLAYVGTLQKDFYVVNISDPTNPIKLGYHNLYSPLYEIVAKDRYVYVANGASGLRIIDVFNPSNPVDAGFYLTGGTAYGLTLDENYVYLSCEEIGLFILKFLPVSENKPPQTPILTLPANKSFVNSLTPQMKWQIPIDEDGDFLHFKVELDKDGDWSAIDYIFESKKDTAGFSPVLPVASGLDSMNYIVQSLLSEENWLWRVSAWDGLVYGQYSEIWSFTVDTTAPVINSVTFQHPGYGADWFNPQQNDSVTLVISYDELYPQISTLSGTILLVTLSKTGLMGGTNQQVLFNFSIANQSDGSYPLQVSIQDSAGNVGSRAAAIRLDSAPPFGYYSDAPVTIREGQNYVVCVSGANDSLGCDVAEIYLDVFTDTTSLITTVRDSMIGITDPGVYYYRYFAVDKLGNRGEIKTDTTVVTPVYSQAPIFPTSLPKEINAGDDFWIDIQVGTEAQPVKNLFKVDFELDYSYTQYIDIVSPDSILPGNWFGTDANIVHQIDEPNGKVTIDISRKTGDSNVDGFGTLARIKFTSIPNTPDQTPIHLTIPSVTAADSEGYSIELIPHDTTIMIIQPFSDFTMNVVPDSQAIDQGDSANFMISFDTLGVFDSQITVSITEYPNGMEPIFESQSFDIPLTDTITFATSDGIAPGIYHPIITATGGGITHADTVVINVLPSSILSDFSMTVVPDSQSIQQGESTAFNLTFQPIGDFDSRISLDISNLPSGMEPAYPTEPFANDTSFSVIFSTTNDILPGIYNPIFKATGGEIFHSDTVNINVLPKSVLSDFSMTVVPDSQTIYQGESTDFALSFQPIGDFDSRISLDISNLPSGMKSAYPTEPFANDTSFSVIFSTDNDIAPGIYKPIFKATGGGITHADTVNIIVLPKSVLADFSMTVVPDSQTIYQGESTDFALSFQPIGEFDSRISLDISNLPSGMDASYPTEPFASDTSFNVNFSTTTDIDTGSYLPTISATGGGITHQATVKITVRQRPDFIMIIEPDSQAVSAGDSVVFYISFQPVGRFNSQITVEVSNLPIGMDAIFTSRTFSIPKSFTITINTSHKIQPGVYYPTVTASGGGITHQETVAINVLTSPPTTQGVSVLPNPFTPNNDGFNDYTEFQYQEASLGNISISIFDVNGRKITEIRDSRFWYGKDDKGREVKPGAYIYVVKNGEKVIAKGVIGVAR